MTTETTRRAETSEKPAPAPATGYRSPSLGFHLQALHDTHYFRPEEMEATPPSAA